MSGSNAPLSMLSGLTKHAQVNFGIAMACVAVVCGFQTSQDLGNAYGTPLHIVYRSAVLWHSQSFDLDMHACAQFEL